MSTLNLNETTKAPWIFTIGTTGRNIGIDGRTYRVHAWDLRQAIRETRKVVSNAWSLRLVRKEREVLPLG